MNATESLMELSRYPRPQLVGSDGGSEFKLHFNQLCDNFGIKHLITGAWNSQANTIRECIHQVLDNCLQTFDLDDTNLDEENSWDEYLAATAFAIRSTVHTTLGASPA